MVRFAEERIFREFPNVFLCVSSINPRARQLYERNGFRTWGVEPAGLCHKGRDVVEHTWF